MEQKITYSKILEWEREVAAYTLNVLLRRQGDNKQNYSRSYELENAVRYITSHAMLCESIITSDLLGIQEEQVSYFVELEKRFKTSDRIREKIVQKMRVDRIGLRDASNSIYDALRYTIVINDEVYIQKVDDYLKKIETLGYQVIKFKNAWGNEYYKGINVSFVDPDGFKFELQFHTPNGYSIKEGKLRDVYNIIRDPDSPDDLVIKANAIRKYYQSQVKIPDGAIDYKFESVQKKRG